jgi:hypothetical protein
VALFFTLACIYDLRMACQKDGWEKRWWFVAFWISFAAFAITGWKSLEITTGVLLVGAFVARILARRRALGEMEKLIKEKSEHDA